MSKILDLRTRHQETSIVDGGTLYRLGPIIQVWWNSGHKETWTAPDEQQAISEFKDMVERWNQP